MAEKNYFSWLSEDTVSNWTNDSAVWEQIEHALSIGAVGCTTNPPLSYEALTTDTALYQEDLGKISRDLPDDEFALQAMGLVVKRISARLMELHEQKGTFYGAVRAQVQPNMRDDARGMLEKGKFMSGWGKNVMVKIPATEAGIWTLEELAALGIPTNPTVVTTVAQAIAAAEAFERGVERARQAGITPAWSTCAFVMGRTQDFFSSLNQERGLGLSDEDLAWASLALVKRTNESFKARGFASILQPAAFRSAIQVEQIAGGVFCSTIHPKIQKAVQEAEASGKIRRALLVDEPVDQQALDRVAKALPEFEQAYDPQGLTPAEFGTYGASKMTLDGFEVTGWQKLVSLKYA